MRLKRAFDLVGSLTGLALSSPVWVLAALAIKLTSPGPVLHRAVRVGRNGEPFTLYKFRSMKTGERGDGRSGGLTLAGDPRITGVGGVLRRLKLDELPQLLNVLRGEMSLVGPRPEDPRYVRAYTPDQMRVLAVPPGMTSPASVAYRDESLMLRDRTASRPAQLREHGRDVEAERVYVTEILPAKLAIELEYLDRRSFWADLRVLAQTAAAVFPASRPRTERS